MNCKDRVALVTGGARRVGRAIVLELSRAGCDVVIHYHHSASEAGRLADEVVASGRRAEIIGGDLADRSCWRSIIQSPVKRWGRLDVLVNNASLFRTDRPDTIEAFDVEGWEEMLRINLVAPAGLCHHAYTHLAADGGGCIVNLCDSSSRRPWSTHLSYCCSKAALATLTRGLARSMSPEVRVNAVAPGIAVFPEDYDSARRTELVSRVPLGREGTPEEVAKLVRFLVESGDYITGQVIAIDGGRSVV